MCIRFTEKPFLNTLIFRHVEFELDFKLKTDAYNEVAARIPSQKDGHCLLPDEIFSKIWRLLNRIM